MRSRSSSRREDGDQDQPRSKGASVGISSSMQRNMENTEEVLRWLHINGMSQYLASFRAHAITGSSLIGLNSFELDKILGVAKLGDRRIILEGIEYLKHVFSVETQQSIPEDGRILTHLSNERVFLSWLRFAVILQTVALATVRLKDESRDQSIHFVTAVSVVLSVIGLVVLLYSTFQYFRMHRMIEEPGDEHVPENDVIAPPLFIALSAAVIGLYATMAIDAETAAEMAIIGV
ncbi:SAM domain containing protein [Gracilaria domingensis]|nr:SAM domain containing protein [Gracilaria domingensis]